MNCLEGNRGHGIVMEGRIGHEAVMESRVVMDRRFVISLPPCVMWKCTVYLNDDETDMYRCTYDGHGQVEVFM